MTENQPGARQGAENKSAVGGKEPQGLGDMARKDRVFTPVGGPSLAKQNHRKECDVNRIMRKFQEQGIADHINARSPRYEDVSGAVDLQEAVQMVQDAQESFDELPAEVRRKFDNDPVAFFEWIHDPENAAEVKKMGLAAPEEVPVPVSLSEADTAALKAEKGEVHDRETEAGT